MTLALAVAAVINVGDVVIVNHIEDGTDGPHISVGIKPAATRKLQYLDCIVFCVLALNIYTIL